MLKNYLVIAWRNMSRHKLYTLINVIGLAIGICSCLAISTIAHYELNFDTFHPDRERIYRLVNSHKQGGDAAHWGNLTEPAPAAIRKEISGLETVAQFHNYDATVTVPGGHGTQKKFPKAGETNNDNLIFAEPHYFDIFKYEWVTGNPAVLEQPFQIILSTSAVERYFGTKDYPSVMGRTLIYDDSINVTVAGIIKDWKQITDFTFTDIISYATILSTGLKRELAEDNNNSFSSSSQAFVKLAKGVTPARVEAQLIPFADKTFTGYQKTDSFRVHLQPLAELHYNTDVYDKDYGTAAHLPTLYGLIGIALFILVLASINFINLSTAQSLRRAKEIGIRKVMGSRRIGLIIQFLSETTVLVFVALLLSLALLYPVLNAFPDFVPAGVKAHVFTPSTIGFGIGILLLTSLLSGFYPAWILSSFVPAQTLKNQGTPKGSTRNRLGKGLVVFQFTISIVFVICTIAVTNQMHFLLNKDMGFDHDAIIRFQVNRKDSLNLRHLLRDRVAQLPGVAKVSLNNSSPIMRGWWKTTIDYKGAHPYKANINVRAGDTNYLSLYKLKLLAGHNYAASDTPREIIINNTYAQLLGFREPQQAIGTLLPLWGNNLPIAGVLADFNQRSLQFGIEPTILVENASSQNSYSVKLKGMKPDELRQTIKHIEKEYKSVFPDEIFTYIFLDENIANFYNNEQKMSRLVNLAMAITIFISCMGLFGLAALTAEQRTREIGIRKVLGARVADISTMLSRDFLLLVLLALVISSPIAWYFMHKWLQDYTYRTTLSWWIFALAGLGAVVIALLTVSFHAIRAALANPVKALRSE